MKTDKIFILRTNLTQNSTADTLDIKGFETQKNSQYCFLGEGGHAFRERRLHHTMRFA